ncbi:MAG: flavodoxin family protein [Candidatus Izemoplasmatales bacterium]|jgi:flavodoxin|nr:flavodoxin family protein [Candidatus Izemoplasmatales bacterium]MDD4987480.1 flavodoxin family protein [Candidatus Izemoplasmatales bacterium]MDD5601989.1 flavodoxin family protein [Candidatus Izemoplasmatales bacterium]MDY0373935.1 flavodoxin family protein [Candidatus Izemoplasmatales bacterium]NLF48463.1 flavodoxin family protein [Acholeplasmataceae bacterium]
MDVLVIYDSFYGNTLRVAELYQQVFADKGISVEVKHVSKIEPEDVKNKKLLIFGSPTRAFRETPGIRKLLTKKAMPLTNRLVFVFDTRIDPDDTNSAILKRFVKWFGYACDHMEKQLKKRGAHLVSKGIGYHVMSAEGPLKQDVSMKVNQHVAELINHLHS